MRSTIDLETAVDLLRLCRRESADGIPMSRLRQYVAKKLIEHKPRAGGGVFADRFIPTARGIDQLLDSRHLADAEARVDATGVLDAQDSEE